MREYVWQQPAGLVVCSGGSRISKQGLLGDGGGTTYGAWMWHSRVCVPVRVGRVGAVDAGERVVPAGEAAD